MKTRERLLLLIPVLLALAVGGAPVVADPVGAVRRVVYTCQTSAPSPINTDRTWVKCSNHHAMRTNTSNVDVDLESGGGGGGMAIGDTVTGGTATRVLYVGAGPVLANDAGMTYDAATDTLTVIAKVSSDTLECNNLGAVGIDTETLAATTRIETPTIGRSSSNQITIPNENGTTFATTTNSIALTNKALGSGNSVTTNISGLGYIAQSSALALGAASTTSASFVDVGNGSSTGFADWTQSVPATKIYLVHIDVSGFSSTGGIIYFQLLVDGSAPTQPTGNEQITANGANHRGQVHIIVPVSLTSGSHTFKLQWKASSGATINVNADDYRTFTIAG